MLARHVRFVGVAAIAIGVGSLSGCGGEFKTGGDAGNSAAGGSGGTSASGGSSGTTNGGASGSSGQGGTSGSGAGGVGGGGPCMQGGSCVFEGSTCTDGDCCPCMYTCRGGTWEMTACAGCAAPSCPPTAPTNGQACNACSAPTGVACEYFNCPTSFRVAVCNGQQWSVQERACGANCCVNDTDCGATARCISTICKPPAASGCWVDSDCAAGEMCSGVFVCPCNADCDGTDSPGTCVPADTECCPRDSHCPSGNHCVVGVCKAPMQGTCWSDRDCAGTTCSGARVCPCLTACLLPDEPGVCL